MKRKKSENFTYCVKINFSQKSLNPSVIISPSNRHLRTINTTEIILFRLSKFCALSSELRQVVHLFVAA